MPQAAIQLEASPAQNFTFLQQNHQKTFTNLLPLGTIKFTNFIKGKIVLGEFPYLIVSTNLLLGFLAGVIMYRSDYCIAGMFRDLFLFRQTFMLKTLLLLISASMLFFEIMRLAGLLKHYPFPLLGPPSLSNIIGGCLFGIGMVLAGGCVVGTLYKMGAGQVLSLVAFLGLVFGSALYAEIHPLWIQVVKSTTLFPGEKTIAQILNVNPLLLILPFLFVSFYFLYRWKVDGKLTRPAHAAGYLQPWKAAAYLAGLGAISYGLIGMPIGITTAYAKMAAYLENIFSPNHVAGLSYFQAVPLKYAVPVNSAYMEGGAAPIFDAISAIQFPLIAGIVLGSAFTAVFLKEFKLRFNVPAKQYISAFIGGTILALASRMSPACNIWHLMGGVPILAAQSLLFLVGLFPGAWMGSILLTRFVLTSRG